MGKRGNPNWKKGVSGNPNGYPGSPDIKLFREAIQKVGKKKGKSFWEHLAEQTYIDNNVLKAVANKFVPDMTMLRIDPESNKIIVEFKK